MSESWLATVRRAAKLREREAAKAALRKHDGNIAAAARELGISRGGLQGRIERWGLNDPPDVPAGGTQQSEDSAG